MAIIWSVTTCGVDLVSLGSCFCYVVMYCFCAGGKFMAEVEDGSLCFSLMVLENLVFWLSVAFLGVLPIPTNCLVMGLYSPTSDLKLPLICC